MPESHEPTDYLTVKNEPSREYRLARWAFALALAGLLLWIAGDVILLFFSSVLVAVFLRSLTVLFGRRAGLSYGWSLLAVILCLTAVIAAGLWLAAPRIASQIDQLAEEMPQSLDRLTATMQQYEWGRQLLRQFASIEDMGSGEAGGALKEVGRGISSRIASALEGALSSGIGAGAYLVIALATGIYLAAGFEKYRRGFVRLFPPHRRARTAEIIDVSRHTLEGWLVGIAVSMTILGILSYVGLLLLGVPLALTFAVITALLTFIPNIGPVISVVPPALLALTEDPMTSIYVLVFYVVLQNTEGLFITPMVQRRTAALPPPILLSTQVLLAAVLGFFGLLLAAPLCALGLVLVQLIYLEDYLGEQVEIPGYTSQRASHTASEPEERTPGTVWQP